MNNNTEPTNGYKEPYVGMPIYLDADDMCDGSDGENNGGSGGSGGNDNNMNSGCLENWPVAMAYVPMQTWKETYEPEVAFKNGTLFPCLNLPFLGGAK